VNIKTAFIIEDEHDLAGLFAEALQAAQYSTEIISDGQLASMRLSEVSPDLVLLDLHLPGVRGKTILQQIREDSRLSSTIVIIASADPHSVRTLEGQADLALVKPITFTQLRDLGLRFQSITQTAA
jgi:DNA-binding response OmpR family regulator